MRSEPTPLEDKLWRRLRSSQLGGYKFRRQMVIEPFICDFFCPAVGLVVEIDGDSHNADEDRERDAILAGKGFKVLRFTNREVAANLEGVLESILATASSMAHRFTHPPAPSLEREGEF
jgi:very-short-patch-repair endonuclease